MNNPMQIIQMMSGIKNPKEYVMKMAQQTNNPILNNLIQMANQGNTKGVEQFANNLLSQQGVDINTIMQHFR